MSRKRPRSDLRIYLHDEAPAIGSGWRGVSIVSIGPKWARLRETATRSPFRLKRATWDAIARFAKHPPTTKGKTK